jgi:hypothetical protein
LGATTLGAVRCWLAADKTTRCAASIDAVAVDPIDFESGDPKLV